MYQSNEPSGSSTSQPFSHKRIDDLFDSPISADRGAKYAKRLFLNLSTLSPFFRAQFSEDSNAFGTVCKKSPNSGSFPNCKSFSRSKGVFMFPILPLDLSCSPIYISTNTCTNGGADSELCTGWQRRILRSTKVTSCLARTLERRILQLLPESSRKPHPPRWLLRLSFIISPSEP